MKENREIDLSNLSATVFKEFVISRKKNQKDGSFVNLSFEGLSVRQNPNLFFFFPNHRSSYRVIDLPSTATTKTAKYNNLKRWLLNLQISTRVSKGGKQQRKKKESALFK